MPAIQHMKSAGFILWGILSSFFGILLGGIAYNVAVDSWNSYSYSYSSRSDDTIEVLVIFGILFLSLGAVLLTIGIYRAFRTFDAMGEKFLFEPYAQQSYAWGRPVDPSFEENVPVGPAPGAHPYHGVSAENVANRDDLSGAREQQFRPDSTQQRF